MLLLLLSERLSFFLRSVFPTLTPVELASLAERYQDPALYEKEIGTIAHKGSPEFEAIVKLLPANLKSRSAAQKHYKNGAWAQFPGSNLAVMGLVLSSLTLVSADSHSDSEVGNAWNLPIAVIFARESLEAVFIVASYYNLIQEALRLHDIEAGGEAGGEIAAEDGGETREVSLEKQREPNSTFCFASGYKAELTKGTILGISGGLIVMGATGAILAGTKSAFAEGYFELFEGISKIAAAFAIGSVYHNVDKFVGRSFTDEQRAYALKNMSVSVFWNVFREMSESLAFILPAMLSNDVKIETIIASSVAGLAIGLGAGGTLLCARSYWNWDIKKFLKGLTYWFTVGLFMGGCHEIEEVSGETPTMLAFEPQWMNQDKFPMAALRIVGYSDEYTYVEAGAWGAAQVALHLHTQIAWIFSQAKRPLQHACGR